MSRDLFVKFLKKYTKSLDTIEPTESILDWCSDKLPKVLLDFWSEHGFGNYGNGLIKVIDPSKYMSSFYTWLGRNDFDKIPILVTAFGDIFYYRKLSATDNDISLLNIHHRQISVCTYSLEEFFEKFIVDDEVANEVLKVDIFNEAIKLKGDLAFEEIFFFTPALILGGGEDIKHIDKGDGLTHQQVLFQLGN